MFRWLLADRALDIRVDRAAEGIEPGPVCGDWLQDHGGAVPTNAHFRAIQAECLGQPYSLGAPRPEELRGVYGAPKEQYGYQKDISGLSPFARQCRRCV